MQPLYTEAKFKAAKSRQPLPLRCLHCTQTFHRPKNIIQIAIAKRDTTHTLCFCSTSCENTHRNPPVDLTCEQCLSPFKKSPCHIRKSKHHFCSKSCAAKWNNAHKTKGTRVSKLERWLQSQLPLLFPSLVFSFNNTNAINAELDIFIPSLKLAFELNGIFHYEPIYGPDKLTKMQTNDARKMLACAERDIELCVIDVSSMSYFKPLKGQKFLDIIRNIVNSRLGVSNGS